MSDETKTADEAPPTEAQIEAFIDKAEKLFKATGENSVLRMNWTAANKDQAARGWAGKVTLTAEISAAVERGSAGGGDALWTHINVGAIVGADVVKLLREARAEVARLRAELEAAREVDAEQQKAWDDRGWSLTP